MPARFVAVLLFAVAATQAPAQTLDVGPGVAVLAGDPVSVVAHGLQPGETVTLRAERWLAPLSTTPKPPRLFRSETRFRADAEGVVDIARSAAIDGSYTGVDARGPFWSMTVVEGESGDAGDTTEVRFKLRRARGEPLHARIRLLHALADVIEQDVGGFPGARFALLPGAVSRPALILLGGSEGGDLIADDAATFASHGYAVLALPYYAPDRDVPGLPEGMVEQPVEYLERARDWLAKQPGVDATRIGLHGTSLGATYALLGAQHFDWVDAVVANVPSDVVVDGWGPGVAEGTRSAFSWRGQSLPFVPSLGYEAEMARPEIHVRRVYERGRAAFPERAAQARIRVEDIRGEVMVIGAYDDQMWPSGMMAQNLAERRLEAGLRVTARLYPEAGHTLYQTGYEPTTHYHARAQKVGGSPQADAQAQADAWRSTLEFLAGALAPTD